jgi:hypothetical protein
LLGFAAKHSGKFADLIIGLPDNYTGTNNRFPGSNNLDTLAREVEIGKPKFNSLDEFNVHAERYSDPQKFIDDFVDNLQGVKPSRAPRYDPKLQSSGSATVGTEEVYRIRLGEQAIHRDSELFKTIFHEEMHLRIDRRINARTLPDSTLSRLTDSRFNSVLDAEEEYVEMVAVRYYSFYQRKFGSFHY